MGRSINVRDKVLRRMGVNVVRGLWHRSSTSHAKWLVRKTLWVVRPQRWRVPVNSMTSSRRSTWLRGSRYPRKGRLVGSRRTQRVCRAGRQMRYGVRRARGCGVTHYSGAVGLDGRRGRSPHARGWEESRAVIRIFRAGLVLDFGSGRERRQCGRVTGRDGIVRGPSSVLFPGSGRRIDPAFWDRKKLLLLEKQSASRRWNGRGGLGYMLVDYMVGSLILRRRPRYGEVVRPVGRDWTQSWLKR